MLVAGAVIGVVVWQSDDGPEPVSGADDRVAASQPGQGRPDSDRSLLHEHGITAPQSRFFLHAHEVTRAELEDWLAENPEHAGAIDAPRWSGQGGRTSDLGRFPATGVPWSVANAYCRAIPGRRLPTEAEWEYAARGRELRWFSWGSEPLDPARTLAYAGGDAALVAVASRDQDCTPEGIRDLMGNAQEWTADSWRSWERPDGMEDMPVYTVRGLRPNVEAPEPISLYGAAFRDIVCSGETCPPDTAGVMRYIGFRCAWSPVTTEEP